MAFRTKFSSCFLVGLLAIGWSSPGQAAVVDVMITFENLSPINSVAFAPLRFGLHNGTFDAFDVGTTATDPIISVAERGNGATWFDAFQAADPTAVLGSVVGAGTSPQPVPAGNVGGNFASSGSQTVRIDTSVNQFFTFASMVVPSNDLFIGNDNPMQYRILDDAGNLLINEIFQSAGQIWDAGSEFADPANGAFVMGGTNSNRTPQNGVIAFDFAELGAFNGSTTNAGYTFSNVDLTAGTNIGRISFSAVVVPEPNSMGLFGLICVGAAFRRLLRKAAKC
jgi:hypothetical protein